MQFKLLGFNYLRRQRLLTLTLIITAASLLFSITALILTGFYKGFASYLGEEENIIAIYNPKARTPYTSSVPAYLAERLAALKGVIAASPEVTAPCLLNGKAIFLRGVTPENLARLNPLIIVEGEALNPMDINSAVVGKNFAQKHNLKINSEILLHGIFSDRYVELQVKGIFASKSVLDDEVLTPLHVGQWLRGMDYSHVSFIRLKINKDIVTPNIIFKVVEAESAQPTQPTQPTEPSQTQPLQKPIIPWKTAPFSLEDVSVEEASKIMQNYMERYGVTREALITVSASVFLFSTLTITIASKTVVSQHKGEINILRSLGTSKRNLKIDLLIKLSPCTIAASLLGMLMASAILNIIQAYGYLQVLSHTVPFQPDPLIIILNLILSATLVSINVLKGSLE
ncbi:MAG: ABC transporter permease [Candidatus Bathyarchaeia archaeon]